MFRRVLKNISTLSPTISTLLAQHSNVTSTAVGGWCLGIEPRERLKLSNSVKPEMVGGMGVYGGLN